MKFKLRTYPVSIQAYGSLSASKARTFSPAGVQDILDFPSNTRFALDVIKMEDEAAFFIVQFLIMYAVKWLFWIALSIATWDREGMSLIFVKKYFVI